MGFRSSFSKSLFQSGPGYRANLAQIGKLCGSLGGMDSAAELADGVAELADGVAEFADGVPELADGIAELADGVITKHGTAVHGTRLPRKTRFRKKMQLSARLGYIHCDAKDVIARVRVHVPVKRHRGEPGHTRDMYRYSRNYSTVELVGRPMRGTFQSAAPSTVP